MKRRFIIFLTVTAVMMSMLTGCRTYFIDYGNDYEYEKLVNWPVEAEEYLSGLGDSEYISEDSITKDAPSGSQVQLPREAQEYLNELGDMECVGRYSVTFEYIEQSVTFKNSFIVPIRDTSGIHEWKLGGLSSLISLMFSRDFMSTTKVVSDKYDIYATLPEPIEYYVYTFISNETGVNSTEHKGCMILIEKGAESMDDPHMYIWSYKVVSGISRPGIYNPSDAKVYMDFKRLMVTKKTEPQ